MAKSTSKSISNQKALARGSLRNKVHRPKLREINKYIRADQKVEKNATKVRQSSIHTKVDNANAVRSLTYTGAGSFRLRIVCSILSGIAIRIDDIRINDKKPGLRDFEVNFLRFIDRITHGTALRISPTGTSVKFTPGVLVGGDVEHECTLDRCVGYLLEPALWLGPFCKQQLSVTFKNCVTNSDTDPSVDIMRAVTIRQMKHFGLGAYDLTGEKSPAPEIKVTKRGAMPLGGGEVFFTVPVVKQITPVKLIDPGMIKRIRGLSYTTMCSSSMSARMITSARSILNGYIADINIYSDAFTHKKVRGNSPGYGIGLAAESTTGCVLSSQRTAIAPSQVADLKDKDHTQELLISPEVVGRSSANALLNEINQHGCVDSYHQSLFCFFMAFSPDQALSRVRFGQITPQTMSTLRVLKDFFHIQFQFTPHAPTKTVVVSCVGLGLKNMNRRAI